MSAKAYAVWHEKEIARLRREWDTNAPAKELVRQSFPTAWVCGNCRYGGPPSGEALFSEIVPAGAIVVSHIHAECVAVLTVQSGFKYQRLQDMFMSFLPQFSCLFCWGCGLASPLPESMGMYKEKWGRS